MISVYYNDMVNNMRKRFDERYNPLVTPEAAYSDGIIDVVPEIVALRDSHTLPAHVADLLIRVVFNKEIKRETARLTKWGIWKQSPEVRTSYVNIDVKKYA